MSTEKLSPAVLDMDYEAEADRIAARIRELLSRRLRRRGLVIAMSGGSIPAASTNTQSQLIVLVGFLFFMKYL